MSEHTPGPWTQGKQGKNKELVYIGGAKEPAVGTGMHCTWIDCNTEANARLIAAAPDLLNALQLYIAHAPEPECAIWRDVQNRARAAIAKATGEAA